MLEKIENYVAKICIADPSVIMTLEDDVAIVAVEQLSILKDESYNNQDFNNCAEICRTINAVQQRNL